MKTLVAAIAFSAFFAAAALPHARTAPVVEAALDLVVGDAVACPGGNGGGKGGGNGNGNAGGNGRGRGR